MVKKKYIIKRLKLALLTTVLVGGYFYLINFSRYRPNLSITPL